MDIDIVALNLVSIEPIVVTYSGGHPPEQWDVRLDHSPLFVPAGLGKLKATKTHCNGGTYYIPELYAHPRYTFTRRMDGAVRVLDIAHPCRPEETCDPWPLAELSQPTPVEWAHDVVSTPDPTGACSHFHAAIKDTEAPIDCDDNHNYVRDDCEQPPPPSGEGSCCDASVQPDVCNNSVQYLNCAGLGWKWLKNGVCGTPPPPNSDDCYLTPVPPADQDVTCPPNHAWGPGYDESTGPYTIFNADAGSHIERVDGFWEVNQPIKFVSWWGVYTTSIAACDKADVWKVTFYNDDGTGKPDATAYGPYTLTPERIGTDWSFSISSEIFRFRAELPVVVSMTDGWVGIQAQTDPANLTCRGAIPDSGEDIYANQLHYVLPGLTKVNNDLAICLSGPDEPGACCNETTLVCNNYVAPQLCTPPLRFEEGELCAWLDPPCGLGACCHPDGTCESSLSAACTSPNIWHSGKPCAGNGDPCPPWNDNCTAWVTPATGGPPYSFWGRNNGATADPGACEAIGPAAWEAFTLTQCMDLLVDYCGTLPVFSNAWNALYEDCSCGEHVEAVAASKHARLGPCCLDDPPGYDANWAIYFESVPQGTWYYPVINEPGSSGPYYLNVTTIGPAQDCNNNNIPDTCDLAVGTSRDCNNNSIPDSCDIASGTSEDCNGPPTQPNGIPDECDLAVGTSADCNTNSFPDDCDLCGDHNGDFATNLDDYKVFYTCLGGPGSVAPSSCNCFLNSDGDTDVDLKDFWKFQQCFNGSLRDLRLRGSPTDEGVFATAAPGIMGTGMILPVAPGEHGLASTLATTMGTTDPASMLHESPNETVEDTAGLPPASRVACAALGCTPNEGEGNCADDYVDNTNNGCSGWPGDEVLGTVSCGVTLCGHTGNYTSNGTRACSTDADCPGPSDWCDWWDRCRSVERDRDWFQITLTEGRVLTWTAQVGDATPVVNTPGLTAQIWSLPTGCTGMVNLAAEESGFDCSPVTMTATVPPGTYAVTVFGKSMLDAAGNPIPVAQYQPCETEWKGTLTCTDPPGWIGSPADACGSATPIPVPGSGYWSGTLNTAYFNWEVAANCQAACPGAGTNCPCTGGEGFSCGLFLSSAFDVDGWWSYTAPCTGRVTFQACGYDATGISHGPSDINSIIGVYSGNCGALVPVECGGGFDDPVDDCDPGNQGKPKVTVDVTTGTTYYVQLITAGAYGIVTLDVSDCVISCDEAQRDCNSNGVNDALEVVQGISPDCNHNSIPDECDVASGGASADCNQNQTPDECESSADCNTNGLPDICDLYAGTSRDCNHNQQPDECDISAGIARDCNANGVPDTCDLLVGTSRDCNTNAVPDSCDIAGGTALDCNSNATPDSCDIAGGTSIDCQPNGTPDECDVLRTVPVTVLSDEFPSTTLDPARWASVSGATVDSVGLNEPSPPYSLRINCNPSAYDYAETVSLNLSCAASGTLNYYWERTGGGNSPEPGDYLRFQFRKADATWVTLIEHPGDGPDMTSYQQQTPALPTTAYHANFRVRVLNSATGGASGYDDWFIDNMQITMQKKVDCNNNGTPDECEGH